MALRQVAYTWRNQPSVARTIKGQLNMAQALEAYIGKELRHGAVMGPYHKIPFKTKVGISPLSTRPKRNSQGKKSHTGP